MRKAANIDVIRSRIRDYQRCDPKAERDQLVALWREAHPECVNQPPSAAHRPLIKTSQRAPGDHPDEPDERGFAK